ncbi:MAG: YkvA family protein [Chloroflexota bacterium]
MYLACRDPRVPWYAKALAGAVLAYALSPIDLIPDFIPMVGYLDDLVIIPAGLALVRRMIPADVLAEHRETAALRLDARAPQSTIGAVVVVTVWVMMLALVGYVVTRYVW